VIPAWKLRREILRLWRMLTFLPMHPVEQAWFGLHPRLFPAAYRVHAGDGPRPGPVAIFLIHQPRGLQATVLATCRHLGAAGFGVHIVSNAPLSADAVARLRPLCARIVERPNHGLDFGGYRHEILACLANGTLPEKLLLLNDSVWFPALRDCDLLDRLEGLGADLAGPVHYAHRNPQRAHLQSYLVLFSARAVASRAFRAFWQGYAMSNNKVRTIRHGEMRLTRFCREGGLSVAALHDAYEAPDLSALPERTRAAVAAHDAARLGDPEAGKAAGTGATGRSGYLLSNHPAVNIGLLSFSILKKDRGLPYQRQRRALCAAEADALRDRLVPEVRAAVEAWDIPEVGDVRQRAQATLTSSTAKVRS
jgi:hypothetical protein